MSSDPHRRRAADDLDSQFLAPARRADPEPIFLAALIWERLGDIEKRLDEVHWCTVDDDELPQHLLNRRRPR